MEEKLTRRSVVVGSVAGALGLAAISAASETDESDLNDDRTNALDSPKASASGGFDLGIDLKHQHTGMIVLRRRTGEVQIMPTRESEKSVDFRVFNLGPDDIEIATDNGEMKYLPHGIGGKAVSAKNNVSIRWKERGNDEVAVVFYGPPS